MGSRLFTGPICLLRRRPRPFKEEVRKSSHIASRLKRDAMSYAASVSSPGGGRGYFKLWLRGKEAAAVGNNDCQ
jgi:hypothetical protein